MYQSDVALLGWALGRCYSSSSLGAHHWRKQWGDVDFGSFESSYLEVNISWFYMILLFKHVIHVHDCSPTIDIHAKDHPSKIGNDWKAGFCEHGSKDIKSKWLKRLKPTTTVTTSLASSWSTRVNPSQPESTRVNPSQPEATCQTQLLSCDMLWRQRPGPFPHCWVCWLGPWQLHLPVVLVPSPSSWQARAGDRKTRVLCLDEIWSIHET